MKGRSRPIFSDFVRSSYVSCVPAWSIPDVRTLGVSFLQDRCYRTVMVTVSEVRVRVDETACTWKWTTTALGGGGGGGGGGFVPVEEVPLPPPHDATNKIRSRENAGIGLAHPRCKAGREEPEARKKAANSNSRLQRT